MQARQEILQSSEVFPASFRCTVPRDGLRTGRGPNSGNHMTKRGEQSVAHSREASPHGSVTSLMGRASVVTSSYSLLGGTATEAYIVQLLHASHGIVV